MSASRLSDASTSSAVTRSGAGVAGAVTAGPCGGDRLLERTPAADLHLVLVLRVEQRLLEPVGVREEPDLAPPGLGAGQEIDLPVADEPPQPGVSDDHVGDHRQRRVARVLVDHAACLDHATRRHEVPLEVPHEEEPADAEDTDREEDPEAPVEDRPEEAGDASVAQRLPEEQRDEPDREREDEPPPRLQERQPVALTHEDDALARSEQRRVAGGLVDRRRGSIRRLGRLGHEMDTDTSPS